jgi:hypothetical protein
MRERYVLVLVALIVAGLALGALPSLLQSGEPYHVTATPVDGEGGYDGPTYNATTVSERRFPFLTSAIENGESAAYYEGPLGAKEAFSHSPFDEFGALETRAPGAVADGVAYVTYDGTVYRVEIVRGDA